MHRMHTVLSITQRGIIPKDFSNNEGQFANSYANYQLVHKGDFAMNHGKDANRVLRAIDSAEKDCGIRLLEADPKAEGVIGSRVLPKGWVARKPSDIGYVLKMVTDKDIIPDEFRELYETFCNTLKIRR